MNDTPETIAAVEASDGQWSFVLKETCAKLERERDQWKADCLEQCKLLAMSADREDKLRSKILMQARVYRGEDLKDNSRWSIFNEGRAQALEKLADETWP